MRSRFFLFLCFLSLALPEGQAFAYRVSRAQPKKTAAALAAKEAHERSCALDYALFETAIARRRQEENPVYDKTRRLQKANESFDAIREQDNAAWIQFAQAANLGQETKAKLFVDMENAVLKELNDKVVQDKDLVTALTNLHKNLAWNLLESDPEIGPHIVARYSDFKSLRLALDSNSPALKKRLAEKLAEINKRYGAYVGNLPEAPAWLQRARGLSSDTRNWFHGGVAANPDLASLASRCSRSLPGLSQLRSLSDCLGLLRRSTRAASLYRGWAAKRFASVDGFLSRSESGQEVLSAEAIDAIRKVAPKENTAAAYAAAVQKVVAERFHVPISLKEAQALRRYIAATDNFSPALFLSSREEIRLGTATGDVVSADFKGQNARNLEETMKALSDGDGKPLPELVRGVRKGEVAATESLEKKKEIFRRVMARLRPGAKVQFSGDDGIAFLPDRLTEREKRLFSRYWAEAGGNPDDIRLTFHNFHFADSGEPVPGEARSALIGKAEGAEKQLRSDLYRLLPRKVLGDTQIAVGLEGSERGQALATVYLSSKQKLPPAVEAEVKRLVEGMGLGLKKVETEIIP